MKANVITFFTRHEAAVFLLQTYTGANWTRPGQVISPPDGQFFTAPGPFPKELVIDTICGAFVVHQTLNGWLSSHVMTLRFPIEHREAA